MTEWRPHRGDQVLHPKRAGRLLEPLRERRFTYDAYDAFLERIVGDERAVTMPLVEMATSNEPERIVVGIRHDVDVSIDSALELGRLEQRRGVRATFFVLHSAAYWGRGDLIDRLLELQDLGHEIGWHNDLVTLEVVEGGDARKRLREELARLREAGVAISGVAPHGSYWAHALGYSNADFFPELGEPVATDVIVDGRERRVPTGTLAEFGLLYDAYHIPHDAYLSDSLFDPEGRRWHPLLFDPATLAPGQRAIILVHPCHWDRSLRAKYARLARRAWQLAQR